MIWFLFIGRIAGWLAGQLTKGPGFGLIGNLVVGVVGSYVGGLLLDSLGIDAYGTIGSIISATLGAVVFLWLWRKLT